MKALIYWIILLLSVSKIRGIKVLVDANWEAWKLKYGKSYSTTDEEAKRYTIWKANYDAIQLHNQNTSRTYDQGINQYMDLSKEEVSALLFGNNVASSITANIYQAVSGVPTSVDWRTTVGVLSAVKYQGYCADSYAFAVLDSVESIIYLKKTKSIVLSAQQIIDCTKTLGNNGCTNGNVGITLGFLKSNGVVNETVYPYQQRDLGTCKVTGDLNKITDFQAIAKNDATSLMAAVSQQPVVVGIDAISLINYQTGVFNECPSTVNVAHAALLVGYDDKSWILKNSWGNKWGDSGYFKISKTGSACGILTNAYIPII